MLFMLRRFINCRIIIIIIYSAIIDVCMSTNLQSSSSRGFWPRG